MIDVRRLETDTPREEAEEAEDADVVVVGATVRHEGTTTSQRYVSSESYSSAEAGAIVAMRPDGAVLDPAVPKPGAPSATADRPPGVGEGAGAVDAGAGVEGAAGGATLISFRLRSTSRGQSTGE